MRPKSKTNPVKKTYYLEERVIYRLAKLAEDEDRSPSVMLERLVKEKWAEKYGLQTEKADPKSIPFPTVQPAQHVVSSRKHSKKKSSG